MTSLVRSYLTRSQGLVALCDQGVVSLTNFLTGLIIGRAGGKSELGLYALAWTMITLANEIFAALITTPYTVFSPHMDTTRRRRYLGSMFLQQIALATLAAVLMLVGMAFTPSMRASGGLGRVVTATAAVIVFVSLREFIRRVCFAELRILRAVLLDVMTCLFQITGVAMLWYAGRLTAVNVYYLLGGLSAAVGFIWVCLNRKDICLHRRSLLTGVQHNWSFAKWLLASGLLWAAAMYLYPWLLTAFHGTAVTGAWAACYSVVVLGNPVLLGLGNYVGPKISNLYAIAGTSVMKRYVYRSSIVFAALLLPLVTGLILFGGATIRAMYGAGYTGNSLTVALLALNLLATAASFPFSRGLFALRAARADMLVNLAAVALLFTFGVATVKSHAAAGAAAALLLSTIATAAIRVVVFAQSVRGSSSPPVIAVTSVGMPKIQPNTAE